MNCLHLAISLEKFYVIIDTKKTGVNPGMTMSEHKHKICHVDIQPHCQSLSKLQSVVAYHIFSCQNVPSDKGQCLHDTDLLSYYCLKYNEKNEVESNVWNR